MSRIFLSHSSVEELEAVVLKEWLEGKDLVTLAEPIWCEDLFAATDSG